MSRKEVGTTPKGVESSSAVAKVSVVLWLQIHSLLLKTAFLRHQEMNVVLLEILESLLLGLVSLLLFTVWQPVAGCEPRGSSCFYKILSFFSSPHSDE